MATGQGNDQGPAAHFTNEREARSHTVSRGIRASSQFCLILKLMLLMYRSLSWVTLSQGGFSGGFGEDWTASQARELQNPSRAVTLVQSQTRAQILGWSVSFFFGDSADALSHQRKS